MVRLNLQTLSYKLSALAIELTSSKAIAGKELSLSSWCIASCIYHNSTVIDFSSEKYSGSTGHRSSSVFYQMHGISLADHLVIRKTISKIENAGFWWKKMASDIKNGFIPVMSVVK